MILRVSSETSAAPEGNLGGRLLDATCRVFGVTKDELLSSDRGLVSDARSALWWVLIEALGWSRPRAAALLGKTDSAAFYGHRRARRLRLTDEAFYDAVALIEKQI